MRSFFFISVTGCVRAAAGTSLRGIQAHSQNVPWSGAVNYLTALALAALYCSFRGWSGEWLPTLAIGIPAGFFYSAALFSAIRMMAQRGLAINVAMANLAMVVPVLIAVFFGERPGRLQVTGIAVGAMAIPLLSLCTTTGRAIRERASISLLVRYFVLQGCAMSGNLVAFKKLPCTAIRGYLVILFLSASIASLFYWAANRRPAAPGGTVRGVVFGVLNVSSTSLMLVSLRHVPATVLFPAISVLCLALSAVVSVLWWKERLQKWGWAGFALAGVATLLLNIKP